MDLAAIPSVEGRYYTAVMGSGKDNQEGKHRPYQSVLHPPTTPPGFLRPSSSHLTPGAAAKFQGVCDYLQKVEEVVIVIAEALPEHQAADHIGHGAAHEESGIERCGWRKSQKCSKKNIQCDC